MFQSEDTYGKGKRNTEIAAAKHKSSKCHILILLLVLCIDIHSISVKSATDFMTIFKYHLMMEHISFLG
jgi:hypothetical protein